MKRLNLLVLALIAPATALAAGVEFEARLWAPDVGGLVQSGNGADAATVIDFVGDLGLDEDGLVEGRLVFRPSRRTSVRLAYASFSFASDAQLDRTLEFSGQTFQLDSRVLSAFELDYGRLGFAWQFLSNPKGSVRFGPLVEIKGFRGDATLSTTLLDVLPVTAREEFEVAFGAAGVVLDVEPSRKLAVFAEWTTLVGADEGDLTDAEAGVRYRPLRPLALSAGYRKIDIDVDDRDDLLRLDLDGLFFGVRLEF